MACAGAILLLAALPLAAQDDVPAAPDDAPEVQDDEAVQPAVRQIGPTILRFRDKEGRLHAMPNLSWEEFSEAMSERADEPESKPAFSFTENNKLSGTVADGRATLDLEYELDLHRSGLVEVPLNLAGAPVVESHFAGPGKHYLQYDEASGGYVALIRADEAESRHQIQLKVRAPISTTETDSRLTLNLPRVVPAKLTLRVPTAKATGKVTSGAEILETRHEGGGTTFVVAQPGGKFTLNWAAPGEVVAKPAPTFDATGSILVRWKSPTQITWDAAFTINVLTDEMSQVKVQIPPGCRLPAQESPGQRIAGVEDAKIQDRDGKELTVPEATIEFDRPVSKGQSFEVRLICERYLEPRPLNDEQRVEVGRFHVVGAARESGVLGIVTSTQWKAEVAYGLSWIQPLELPAGFREAGVLGSDTYRYVAPDTLAMRVTARQSRVAVAPLYILHVSQNRLQLEARLAYRVVGARLDACRGDWPGWNVDRIELVENGQGRVVSFEPFQTEPLEINLPQTMRGDFELRVLASQPLNPDTGEFAVAIPRISADEALPATVIVQPEDNVDLAILENDTKGLEQVETAPAVELPTRQQRPIVLREGDDPAPQLAGGAKPLRRSVTAAADAEIFVDRSSCRLVQTFEFHVLYEPLAALLWEAPAEFGDLTVVEVLVNDEQAKLIPGEDGLQKIEFEAPLKGEIVVKVVAQRDFAALEPDVTTTLNIPLLRPAEELEARYAAAAQITAAANVRVETQSSDWAPMDDTSAGAEGGGLRLTAKTLPDAVQVFATFTPPQRRVSTVVEKAWLQTWLSGSRRHDRAVYQLRTNGDRVWLKLPPQIDEEQMVLLVDGVDMIPVIDPQRRLELSLRVPNSTGSRSPDEFHRHLIECWWPDANSASGGQIQLIAPQVADAWTMKTYWHVVVPGRRLSLFTPAGMDAETNGSRWWWQRQPRMTQEELEKWCGASRQISPESGAGGGYAQYLFSSAGLPAEAIVSTTSTATTMLLFAVAALGIGLLFYYVRAMRHPAVLGAASVVVAYLAFVWPTVAVFMAQAVLLALGVVICAMVLQQVFKQRWSMWRRYSAPRVSVSPSTRRVRTTRTDSVLAGSPSTTATAAALPGAGTDSP